MSLNDVLAKVKQRLNFYKECTIYGTKYELSILTLKEEQYLSAIDSDEMDPAAYYSEMQKTALSYSIKKIDGEEIPDIIEEDSGDGKKVTKERPVKIREFLDFLPSKVTTDLFDIYVDLREEADDVIGKNTEYTWFKSPEEREKERKEKLNKIEAEEKASEDKSTKEEKSDEDKNYEEIKLRKIEEPVDKDEVNGQ